MLSLCRWHGIKHGCGVPTAMMVGSSLSRLGSLKSVPEMGVPQQVMDGGNALRRGGGQEADQGWGTT